MPILRTWGLNKALLGDDGGIRPHFLGGVCIAGVPLDSHGSSWNPHAIILQSAIVPSNHHSLHPTKTNVNLHPPCNRGHDELPNPIVPSPTFQLKSITFLPYILASSSDSYDPKTSVANFMLPRTPAFFSVYLPIPKPATTRSCQNFTADLGISPWPAVATTARILDSWLEALRKATWNDTMKWMTFFDQKGVGWIRSPVIWKLYNLYKFCLLILDGGLLSWLQVIFVKVFVGWVYSRNLRLARISYLGIYLE